MQKWLYSWALALWVFSCFGQEPQVFKETVYYTPPENGFNLSIQIRYKFMNCYGDVSLLITKDKDQAKATTYIYNGVEYDITNLDIDYEKELRSNIDYTDVSADMHQDNVRLGNLLLKNVVDYDVGGCFGQTYHVTEILGLDDAAYKDRVHTLSLHNLRITKMNVRSYKIEALLKELEKEKGYDTKMAEARQYENQQEYAKAADAYQAALRLKPGDELAKSGLARAKQLKEEKADEVAAEKAMEEGREHERKGNLDAAKEAYEKAAALNPDDDVAKSKAEEMAQKIAEQREQVQNVAQQHVAAGNRSMQFTIKGGQIGSAAYGTGTQETWMIGDMQVEVKISVMAGEPVYQTRFYWNWHNYQYSDYPLYISVLKDTVEQISQLQEYPDLLARWNALKPQYLALRCDIASWKNGERYVADDGRIFLEPAAIGKAGEWGPWSQPASCSWEELFPYTNGMNWTFFEELGLREEMNECENNYDNDNCWPKYAFQYSTEIDFGASGYEDRCATFRLSRAKWRDHEVEQIVKEFKRREKAEEEGQMTMDDFWNTPENTTTQGEAEQKQQQAVNTAQDSNGSATSTATSGQYGAHSATEAAALKKVFSQFDQIMQQRYEKYRALQNPFNIQSPSANFSSDKCVITVEASVNKYFNRPGNKVFLLINGLKQEVNLSSSGYFKNEVVLASGQNRIELVCQGSGFELKKQLTGNYTGRPTDLRVTLVWNTSSSDLDLYVTSPSGSTCYYSSRSAGGMQLDVDDQNGYGPENISVMDGEQGYYKVYVRNYSGGNGSRAKVYIYVNEQLHSVKEYTMGSSQWDVENVYLNP